MFLAPRGTGSTDEVYLDTNQVDLENNIFSLRSGMTPVVTKNNFGGDPQIDAFYKPIIVPQSPAINSGNNNPPDGLPSTDLDGGPRKIGSIVDRGAYESIVDPSPTQIVTTAADNDSAGLSLRTAITSVPIPMAASTIQVQYRRRLRSTDSHHKRGERRTARIGRQRDHQWLYAERRHRQPP